MKMNECDLGGGVLDGSYAQQINKHPPRRRLRRTPAELPEAGVADAASERST